jgi:hypothetical protein
MSKAIDRWIGLVFYMALVTATVTLIGLWAYMLGFMCKVVF